MPHLLILRGNRDDVRIRTALALSILVHAAALLTLLPPTAGRLEWPGPDPGSAEGLQVELVARAAAPAAMAAQEEAPAFRGAKRASAPAQTVRVAPAPAALATVAQGAPTDAQRARETLSLLIAPQSPASVADTSARGPEWWRLTAAALAQARAAPSAGGDLSSSIAARRRAYGEESAAAHGEVGEHASFGWGAPAPHSSRDDDRRHRGGVFTITRMAYDDGEFLFYGWKDDPDPQPTQAIKVRLGANPDMRIAIVRRMIALIRERERSDFQWQSRRLGHTVELSARLEDSVALETFLLREFFEAGERVVSR